MIIEPNLAICASKDINAQILKNVQAAALSDLTLLDRAQCRDLGLKHGTFAQIVAHYAQSAEVMQWYEWAAQSRQHHLLTWFHPDYPQLLRQLDDAPTLLFACGNLSVLKRKMIAIVGSRQPTTYGKHNAQHFAHELASVGWCVVSGFALGIDSIAHRATIAAAGSTIAVLGCGIEFNYPKPNHQLKQDVRNTGLLLSEYPPSTPPKPHHFPQRNRLIAGLAEGTLVVEASMRSGSLITARHAITLNREVYAIPGTIQNTLTKGTHALIKQGAKLVEGINDIYEELSQDKCPQNIVNKPTAGLESSAKLILRCMGFEPLSHDQLAQRCELPPDQINCHLIELEMAELIQPVPGGFIRKNNSNE